MTIALRVCLVISVLMLGGCAVAAGAKESEVIVNVNHSRFDPAAFEFETGTTVRFVIHNADPIDHEFLLGDDADQDRHENGTHAEHGAIPGEVSLPAGSTRSTTYTFTEPGKLIIGCHLPAHFAYGMRADVTVTP
ncbi:MAG: cupredoxin domain-containing protein [Actinomycetota bacterium]